MTASPSKPVQLRRRLGSLLIAVAATLSLAGAASAQPFSIWVNLNGPESGFHVPASAALNPTSAITLEGWVSLDSSAFSGCWNFIGKNYTTAWWVGVCDGQLRSYVGGTPSVYTAGNIPVGQWTHFAVTSDGVTRLHYINGELVGTHTETTAITTNGAGVGIGTDVAFLNRTPKSSFNEFRLWNVARTVDQIRSTINVPITSARPGLVSVWGLRGDGSDPIGGHNGVAFGSVLPFTFAVILNCGSSTATALCLNTRFNISTSWRVGGPNDGGASGTGRTVSDPNPNSGLFWFFDSSNWEVMVKVINGCALNNRYWLFSAATTNVFYRMEVFDVRAGVNKIYFNYPGPPAPAVTDTAAFPCP